MRVAPILQTYTGLMVELENTPVEKIVLLDIAHALGAICRYNGHTTHHYSVAEHSVHICRWLQARGNDANIQRLGLLHDAPEYILGDKTRPLKTLLGDAYTRLEHYLWLKMMERFGLTPVDPAAPFRLPNIIKEADNRILMNERDALFHHKPDWGWTAEPLEDVRIQCWSRSVAKYEFMCEASRLGLS